jgi:hypothetical protein
MSALQIPQKYAIYFADPDKLDDVQREVILAKDLATVQDIYSEYRVISIEVVDDHPANGGK